MKKFFFIIYLCIIAIIFDFVAKKIFDYELNAGSFCYDEFLLYNYCPNSRHVRILENKKIVTYINEFGISYDKEKELIEPSESKIVILGDSFIQADEVPTEKRIANYFLKDGIKTIQIGYGSWNPYQYENIFNKFEFHEEATFLIFLMSNDFFPGYSHSYLSTYKQIENYKNSLKEQIKYRNSLNYKLKIFFKEHSFIGTTIAKIRLKYRNRPDDSDKEVKFKKVEESHLEYNMTNCSLLDKYESKVDLKLFGYLTYSKNSSCWSKENFEEVNSIIKTLKKIKSNLKSSQRVIFFFITPGWSYEGENIAGKKRDKYNLDENILITQLGLSRYLKKILKDDFYDTEKVLKKVKKRYPKNNSLYFNTDGHWNQNAHFEIYKWLKKDIL